MKKYLIPACLILFQYVQAQTIGNQQAPTDQARLDELMQAASEFGNFHGVALVASHDSILLFKGYGYRDVEHEVLHDTNSVFQVGSVTKQFTATLILWLQEHGLLQLTDPVSKFFPAYEYGTLITIQNLLNHSSGLPDYTDQWFMEHEAFSPYGQKDFWNAIGSQGLHFDPGTEFEYNNSNYTLLGYIIEKVSGKSYEQMMREVIFKPAGMTHSGLDFAGLTSPYRSVGYDHTTGGDIKRSKIEDASATFAAGALYTTAGDLYRWSRALLSGRIISMASLQQAFTPGKGGYGYGWYIQYGEGVLSVAHAGGILGFQSYIKLFPREHHCVILLSNEIVSFGDYATGIQRILYHDPNYYIPRRELTLGVDSLAVYRGHYELRDKPEFKADIVVRDGQLQLTWTGLAPQVIYPESKDLFHFKVYNSQLMFARDPGSGRITGFTAFSGTGGQRFEYRLAK